MEKDAKKETNNKPMKKKKGEGEKKERIVIVRVRGRTNIRKQIADTLDLLNLTRVNHCVIVPNTPQYMGMINKAKDYVTYGEINLDAVVNLLQKRCLLNGNKRLDDEYLAKNTDYKSIEEFANAFMGFDAELKEILEIKPVFRLRPPKKGYERQGIKKPFSVGGALGYRKDKINDLLGRMI